MKLTNNDGGASTSGVVEETTARIKVSPHAFSILASGLYTDKIAAVLREVGCNARDAHVAAGKANLPIRVKLPTPLDRTFSIKDWGIGLDKEEVMNMYVTFFESTKSNSDDFVGAFGLGSKSPFAYTDSFTVVAAKDGVQRTFTVYRENGVPKCVFMHESAAPADWQNGLEVSFSVKATDVGTFAAKAAQVYEFWDVRPEFAGADVVFPDYKVRVDYPSCALLLPNRNPAMVVMGGVCYPLDKNIQQAIVSGLEDPDAFMPEELSWVKAYSQDATQKCLRELLSLNLGYTVSALLKAPIGLLQVTPSRESLSMDKDTARNLRGLVLRAAREICEKLVQDLTLKPGETVWDLTARADEVFHALGRGPAQEMLRCYHVLAGAVTGLSEDAQRVLTATLYVPSALPVQVCETSRRGTKVRLVDLIARPGQGFPVSLSAMTVFVIDDLGKRAAGAIRTLAYARDVWTNADSRHAPVYLIKLVGKTVAEVREALGNPPDRQVVLASSLPKPTRVRLAVTGGGQGASGGQMVATPKQAVGNVQAALWQWDSQDKTYALVPGVDRVALLDGAKWTIIADYYAHAYPMGNVLVKTAVSALSDDDRRACGLDAVVVLKRAVYERYVLQANCTALNDCLRAAVHNEAVMQALLPLITLLKAKDIANYQVVRPTHAALLSVDDIAFMRRLSQGAPYGFWLKNMQRMVRDIESAVAASLVPDVLRISIAARRRNSTESDLGAPSSIIVDEFTKQRSERGLRPVDELVPSLEDWAEAFSLAFADDVDAIELGRLVARWDGPSGEFLPQLFDNLFARDALDHANVHVAQSERVLAALKRLSAHKRRQQLSALKRERVIKRSERRKRHAARQVTTAGQTLDMFDLMDEVSTAEEAAAA